MRLRQLRRMRQQNSKKLRTDRMGSRLSPFQIEKMSRKEKLQAMEAIWADLSKPEAEVESPAWHESVLRETEVRVATGQERIADWDIAKRELRKRFE